MIQALLLGGLVSALPSLPYDPQPDDWPTYQRDSAHSGASVQGTWTGPLARTFAVTIASWGNGGANWPPPIVVGDALFGWTGGVLWARDRFYGGLFWSKTFTSDWPIATPMYAKGQLLAQTSYTKLASWDPRTGDPLWTIQLGGTGLYSQARQGNGLVVEGSVAYAVHGGVVTAVDILSHAVLWNFEARVFGAADSNISLIGFPAYEAGVLYFSYSDGRILGVNTASKTVVFDKSLPSSLMSSPTVDDGILYIGDASGVFTAFSTANGSVIWTYHVRSYIQGSPAIYGDWIALVSDDRAIYVFHKKTGILVCNPFVTMDNYAVMNVIFMGDKASAGGCSGGLHVVDPALCSEIWNHMDPRQCGYWNSNVTKDGWIYAINMCKELEFWGPPSYPTPTRTSTPLPTHTRTKSPTPCAACTSTGTPAPSLTLSQTAYFSMTPRDTPTPTLSRTFSPTSSQTLTHTGTGTPTASPSVTRSSSPTATGSRSGTRTSSPTQSPSPTWTPTSTRTWTLTWTPSLSPSPTPTPSRTNTFTYTNSPSLTFSGSPTPTRTSTPTYTSYPSKTGTRTTTPTRTSTPKAGEGKDAWLAHNELHPAGGKDCVLISSRMKGTARVTVKIYTTLGELAKTVWEGERSEGLYEDRWCCDNWRGETVASGFYIVVVETPWYTFRDKAIVVK